MENYKIITQGNAIYLETKLLPDETLDEVDRGMLFSNRINGLLPVSIQWINMECRLLYNITGLTPLDQGARILENEKRLMNFFTSISHAETECDEYLLSPQKLDLDPEHVFLDANGKAQLLYRPVKELRNRYQPTELAHFVFRLVGRQMPTGSMVITALSRQLLYGDSFSFAEMEKELSEINETAKEKAPQPAPISEPKMTAPSEGYRPPQRQPSVQQPVKQPERTFAPAAPAGIPEAQPAQDNPFAPRSEEKPAAAAQPSVEPAPEHPKEEKAKKGGFLGLFGRKDKKKAEQPAQENPFQQKASREEKPVERPVAYDVPQAQPKAQAPVGAGGYTVILNGDDAGSGNLTRIMEDNSPELYLVQKSNNQYIHITHSNFHIGRAADVVDFTVQTATNYLGNDHAYILIQDGAYYIVDNNTRNHTYLNEQRLQPSQPQPIHAGDTIRMADVIFTVVAGS